MRVTGAVLLGLVALSAGCARSPEAKKARHLERGDRYFKQEQFREAVIEYRNALRIESNNPQAIRQLGLAHYELGQLNQAFRFLLKAQELEPDNSQLALKLATIYLLAGKADDAQGAADRVLQREPKNLEALILSAGAANSPEEVEEAIRRLEGARGDFDSRARYHLALANLYGRRKDPAAAERAFQTALVREPNSADAHLQLGTFYVLRGDAANAEQQFKAAAALAPSGSATQLRLADFYLSVGKPEEAKRVLSDMTTKAPDYLPAWRRLAEIAVSERRLDDASKALDVVFKKNSADLDAHLLLGRIHLARRNTTGAIQEFRVVLKAEPRFAPAHYQLGLAQLQAGDVQQAKAALKEAITIAPNFAEAILALARVNLQSGAVQPAVDDLERLVAAQPRLTGAHLLLGAAYLSQKKPARAGDIARKLIAAAPKDPRGPDLLGVSLTMQGKPAEARREFEGSLALSPGYLDPLSHLVSLDLAEKQVDAAIARVQRQIVLVPGSGPHHGLLGDLYLRKRDTKAAEATLLKAIELEPRLFSAYLSLGSLYIQSGQYDQAIAKLDQAAQATPTNPAPRMITGIVYELKGDIPKAREAYEKVLAVNPRFGAAANNLAWIYSEHGGDKDKALQLAQTAKEILPDDPRVSDTLGWILYKRGIYQRALTLLRESAAKLGDNPQVQYHLGMAHLQVGDKEAARKALQAAVSSPATFRQDEARKALRTEVTGTTGRRGAERHQARLVASREDVTRRDATSSGGDAERRHPPR
jgi:tetratricopeptide (TPR) repeat protein